MCGNPVYTYPIFKYNVTGSRDSLVDLMEIKDVNQVSVDLKYFMKEDKSGQFGYLPSQVMGGGGGGVVPPIY